MPGVRAGACRPGIVHVLAPSGAGHFAFSRIRRQDSAIRRDTCIGEMPSPAAMALCLIPAKKRRWSTSFARSAGLLMPSLAASRSTIRSKARSSAPAVSPRRTSPSSAGRLASRDMARKPWRASLPCRTGDVHGPHPVPEVPLDLTDDGRHGERQKGAAASWIVPVHGVYQADRSDLPPVLQSHRGRGSGGPDGGPREASRR